VKNHGVQLSFAGERAGHSLVVEGGAFVDPALIDQRDPDLVERAPL